MNKKIVAGAIIVENGRIFIACRPEGKTLAHHWEFPGGKQEREKRCPTVSAENLKKNLTSTPLSANRLWFQPLNTTSPSSNCIPFLLPWKSRKTSNPTNMRKPPGFSLAN